MLIDKEKLITELKSWQNRLRDTPEEDFVSVILKAVIDKVTGQPLVEIPDKWIPVEDEHLPKDENYVLVSFKNFSVPDIARYERDKDGGGRFYPGDDNTSYAEHGLLVNAWQPLPESYKGE